MQLLEDPKDVAECTLQPVRRYDIDAAILFSDILVVAEAMGIEVIMPGGKGIQVPSPLESPSDLARITLPADEAAAKALVDDKLSHVIAAVQLIVRELDGKVPLIGFSAAPWTLFYYMVGGSSKKGQELGEKWLAEHPEESAKILDALEIIVIEYLSAQADGGAHILQLFEAMGDFITPPSMEAAALPRMPTSAMRSRSATRTSPSWSSRAAPRTLCRRSASAASTCSRSTTPPTSPLAAMTLPKVCLQGAFDPALLVRDNGSDEAKVQAAVKEMLDQLGSQKLIANLREGLSGKEDPALVAAFVEGSARVRGVGVRDQLAAERIRGLRGLVCAKPSRWSTREATTRLGGGEVRSTVGQLIDRSTESSGGSGAQLQTGCSCSCGPRGVRLYTPLITSRGRDVCSTRGRDKVTSLAWTGRTASGRSGRVRGSCSRSARRSSAAERRETRDGERERERLDGDDGGVIYFFQLSFETTV